MNFDNKGFVYFMVLVVTAIWSVTFVSTKELLAVLSPTEILVYRYVIAYAAFCLISPSPIVPKNLKDEGIFALCGVLGVSLYFLLENFALYYSTASNVSLIVSTAPMLTGIVAHFFTDDEKMTRGFLWGCVFGLGGVFLIIFNGHFILHLNPLGDAFAILGALSFAVYSILIRNINKGYSPVEITRKTFFYALLSLVPLLFTPAFNWKPHVLMNTTVIFHLTFLGIFASALCFIVWNRVIWALGAVKANNLIYLTPPGTMIAAALLIDERITVFAVAGCLLILVGVFAAQFEKSSSRS